MFEKNNSTTTTARQFGGPSVLQGASAPKGVVMTELELKIIEELHLNEDGIWEAHLTDFGPWAIPNDWMDYSISAGDLPEEHQHNLEAINIDLSTYALNRLS